MTREEVVNDLLDLLCLWVKECDAWDAHNACVVGGEYKNKTAQVDKYRELEVSHTLPLIQKCKASGFKLLGLVDIIAPGAKTDRRQRQVQLTALDEWAKKEFSDGAY